MNRRILSLIVIVAVMATLSVVCVNCSSDTTAPTIYFLAPDGSIDKKGDTTILIYTKYDDPGCYVEDNASDSANITVASDLETVLQIERKIASHIGEVKKTGEYMVTYTATDEAGNVGTRSKKITCKNLTDIYTGKYWTKRDELPASIAISSVARDTAYYSNVASVNTVAGRLRFSKVALHTYNGQKVSFKVDADLYSPEHSPRTRSDQIGFLGRGDDKDKIVYEGMTYDEAVDSLRLEYVYLQIPTREYTAYTEGDAAVNDYTVRIQGRMDGTTPKSKIVYDEKGVMLYIVLELSITVGNQSIQNYVERYYLE